MVRVGIVGAGPAGCLTARHLSDAGHHVTLFEAGERLAPTIDFASLLGRGELFWPDDPVAAAGVRRARVVGGASAINGMLLSAPDSIDLGSWDTALGLAAGSARSALERVIAEMAPQIAGPGPLARGIGAAALARGEHIGGSTLDVDAGGLLAAALANRSGVRRDPAAVFLDGASSRLTLATGTTIVALDQAPLDDFEHVVLSAGALASPRLLASAGSGGVGASAGSGGVGVPAQQHRAVALTVELPPGRRVEREQPAVSRVVRWSTGLDTEGDVRHDVQLVIVDHMGWDPVGRARGLVIVSLLSGATLGDPIDELDRARLRVGVRRGRELLDAASFVADVPDRVVADDDELDRWIVTQPNPVHHLTSTLPIGSVVGPAGLVDGRTDLSVIDASVLPASPRADTNMPVLVVADLLATQLVDHLA